MELEINNLEELLEMENLVFGHYTTTNTCKTRINKDVPKELATETIITFDWTGIDLKALLDGVMKPATITWQGEQRKICSDQSEVPSQITLVVTELGGRKKLTKEESSKIHANAIKKLRPNWTDGDLGQAIIRGLSLAEVEKLPERDPFK